jgi:hypothetical protein
LAVQIWSIVLSSYATAITVSTYDWKGTLWNNNIFCLSVPATTEALYTISLAYIVVFYDKNTQSDMYVISLGSSSPLYAYILVKTETSAIPMVSGFLFW